VGGDSLVSEVVCESSMRAESGINLMPLGYVSGADGIVVDKGGQS
jgi:hypothetical protein